MKTKTKRVCRGMYEITLDHLRVVITQYDKKEDGFGGWIARAGWCVWTLSDPLPTLAAAKREADGMIADRIEEYKSQSVRTGA